MAKNKKDNLDSFQGLFLGTKDQEPMQGQESMDNLDGGKHMPAQTIQTKTVQVNKRMGRPKEKRETKKRVSFAIMPSLYDDIKKIAYIERLSISEAITSCLEEYVSSNERALAEYDKIKK